MSKIDDILFRVADTASPDEDGFSEYESSDEQDQAVDEAVNSAKSELLILLVEVIGEDEKTEKRGPLWDVACQDCFEIPEDHTRNQLKAEQRKRAKELFGVEE